jgi:hypothetical protein
MSRKKRKNALSRRDRSPCRRLTPPSLCAVSICPLPEYSCWGTIPSSFFSSAAGASSPPVAAPPPAPPVVGAAAAPPPEPTFRSRSLTSLPSRAYPASEMCRASHIVQRAHLGEERCPDGLDVLNLGGLDQRLELVGLVKLA